MTLYVQLFLSFLQVGAFAIGGGYAAMPLIQSQVVTLRGWLTMAEFTDLVTIAEMTPGPIAINAATFVGIRVGGLLGAVVATVGCVVPPILIVSLLAFVYYRYKQLSILQSMLSVLRPAVVALIASAGFTILRLVARSDGPGSLGSFDVLGLGMFAAAFFVLRRYRLNPILVMAACGATRLLAGVILGA